MTGGNLGAAVQMLKVMNQQGGGQSWASKNPTGLTATVYNETTVDLTWTNPGTLDYTGHKIYQSVNGGATFTLITTRTSILESYRASGLIEGTAYVFKVALYIGTNISNGTTVSATPIKWWLAGGLAAEDCVAAYTPGEAETLADSYINKANPGTSDLYLGVAPVLQFNRGWNFNGSTQFLKTNLVPLLNYSYVIAFADCGVDGDKDYCLLGSYTLAGGEKAVLIQRSLRPAPIKVQWANGPYALSEAPSQQEAVLGMSATKGYLNGIERDLTGNINGIPLIQLFLGALNYIGNPIQFIKGSISAVAVYNKSISATQQLALKNSIPVVNSQKMKDYCDLNFGAFLCWSMSTFYGVDAGYVDGDVEVFNPTDLDMDEWLDTFVTAGMNYATICAKTEDGWCLWPTTFADPGHTPYGIGSTTWYAANGNYDILKHYLDGCRSRNLKPVVYFSIRDLTHEARSGTDEKTDAAAYIAMIKLQLSELLTNYGEITALWFDDWNWHISYDDIPYKEIYDYVKALQPNCLILNNEQLHPAQHGDIEVYEPETGGGIHVPSGNLRLSEEVETIRTDGVWAYDDERDQSAASLKSKAVLLAAIAQANGRNSNYLTGVSPDKTGHLTAAQKLLLESLTT